MHPFAPAMLSQKKLYMGLGVLVFDEGLPYEKAKTHTFSTPLDDLWIAVGSKDSILSTN